MEVQEGVPVTTSPLLLLLLHSFLQDSLPSVCVLHFCVLNTRRDPKMAVRTSGQYGAAAPSGIKTCSEPTSQTPVLPILL